MKNNSRFHKKLYTTWGQNIDKDNVLSEYPRPLLKRGTDSYINLNGIWKYAFTGSNKKPVRFDSDILVPFSPEAPLSGVNRQLKPDEYLWYERTVTFDINRLSDGSRFILHFGAVDQICSVYINGIKVCSHSGGYLPFETDITDILKRTETKSSFRLNVRVKDLSDTSYHARGKQSLEPKGMFYTAQSGIWQTVWLEYVPETYIKKIIAKPDLDKKVLRIKIVTNLDDTENYPYHISETPKNHNKCQLRKNDTKISGDKTAYRHSLTKTNEIKVCINNPDIYIDTPDNKTQTDSTPKNNRKIYDITKNTDSLKVSDTTKNTENSKVSDITKITNNRKTTGSHNELYKDSSQAPFIYYGISDTFIEIPLDRLDIKTWTPDTPYLYTFSISMGKDYAESYFALRTFTIERDKSDIPRICLNHRPIFQKGVLDQGYWPDGLYTAPCDRALIYDIKTMKSLGFNMLRKHIKIESDRWYYHCDRLGMIVWQDMVNGGSEYKSWFVTYLATLMSFFDTSCIDKFTYLFSRNSKKGRKEFIRETIQTIKTLSGHPSIAAWVIFNEGWGQFDTNRITKLVRRTDSTRLIDQASGWFDQGGGDIKSIHNYFFPLRLFKEDKRAYALTEYGGYTKAIKHHNAAYRCYGYGACKNYSELKKRYEKREKEISALIPQGLCASIYTQLSDVENELNGILTYDRAVNKFDKSKFDKH